MLKDLQVQDPDPLNDNKESLQEPPLEMVPTAPTEAEFPTEQTLPPPETLNSPDIAPEQSPEKPPEKLGQKPAVIPELPKFLREKHFVEPSAPPPPSAAADNISPSVEPAKSFLAKIPKLWLIGGGLLITLLGGGLLLLPKALDGLEQWQQSQQIKSFEQEQTQASEVLKLVDQTDTARDAKLQAIAAQPNQSLERSRARYLLANDRLKQFEGGPAVQLLENLENEYPVLAPYILLKRGRGYELSNEKIKANETWQAILPKYPHSPVTVEALYLLGKSDSKYWEQAIADYPNHPRTLDILLQKLKKEPKSLALMSQIMRSAPENPKTNPVRDQLLKEYKTELTPEDWQAIGASFWQERNFDQALLAYGKAPENAQNLYRLARAQQIKGKKAEAIQSYRLFLQKYPDHEDAPKALKRLATLVPAREGAAYLDQLIQRFPNQAPDALLQKANLLASIDAATANQALQTLLKQYSNSDAAAQYRWQMARQLADAGDLSQAWQWAQELSQQNPDSTEAPKAIFWIGKWAQQLNRPEDAKAAFENVLARYPQSYYAWRSAVLLGWQVGDFNTVRFLNPPVTATKLRPLPPAGSATFKELYQLGQDRDAIALFAAEINQSQDSQVKRPLTVEESFTDALLKISQNQYLAGINQILDLRNPTDPEQEKIWRSLRQTPEYWQTLFPFPYQSLIFNWSQKRQLNPFLVTALIRQESRFEKDIKSPVGATGLMQVMPSTAAWIAPQIKLKNYALSNPMDNVNLGTWYFDHTHKTYSNNSALAVASYNAGPGNVAKWLQQYQGSDPDGFVEKIPFAETKGYVESVFSNYWNYLRIYDPDIAQLLSRVPNQ
jgi:soluble lytic murein transglycosylase